MIFNRLKLLNLMTIKGVRKNLILLKINDCCYLKKLTIIICVKVCQRCAKLWTTVLKCAKVGQSVLNCAQLCQRTKINLFLVAKSFLC